MNVRSYDVIVVGAGNAALCAAISAREQGSTVLVLEKAPKGDRGGNSTLTLNMRFSYDSPKDVIPLLDNITEKIIQEIYTDCPSYSQDQFYNDLIQVTNGQTDQELARVLVSNSLPTMHWLRNLGHSWVYEFNPLAGSLRFYMNGGGYSHQKRSFEIAENLGVDFYYDCSVKEILINSNGIIQGVLANTPNDSQQFFSQSVILACGGFENNEAMRSKHLGPEWQEVHIRGVPFNTGDGLRMAEEVGAKLYGSWNTCHASPQDPNLPRFSMPKDYESSRKLARYFYPYGVTVNRRGKRFIDEGENLRNLTYAKLGKAILKQEDAAAFQIFDSKTSSLFLPYYKNASGFTTNSLRELAELLNLETKSFLDTIEQYNASVSPKDFQPYKLDGKATEEVTPPKSNWAAKIDKPPFFGFPVICGLTFTFGGVKINSQSEVLSNKERPIPGLYAAGEMVGGLYYDNYPGGSGMMSGAVFGRIAGQNAAKYANSS